MEPFLFEKKHSKTMSKNLKISQNFSNVVFQTWFCETGFCIAYFFLDHRKSQKNSKKSKNHKKSQKKQKISKKSFKFAWKKTKKQETTK